MSQRTGMGPAARPQVQPLPHLHVIMAQSQQQQQRGGAAGGYQFGGGSRSSAYDIRPGPAYAESEIRSNSNGNGSSSSSHVVRSMYPSTLMPSGQIHAQHQMRAAPAPVSASMAAPVKLLQSCDSCRRRKIRCSGEKPTCSACVRYQEMCHYSPLATPRRRAGKRARTGADEDVQASPDRPASDAARSARGSSVADSPPPTHAPDERQAPGEPGDAADVGALQQEVHALSRKFDSLSDKLDRLLDAMGGQSRRQRRRVDRSGSGQGTSQTPSSGSGEDEDDDDGDNDDNDGDNDGDAAMQSPGSDEGGDAAAHEFSSLIDNTSRFGIDATNVGVISQMISHMSGQPSAGVRVSTGAPAEGEAAGTPRVLAKLDSPAMRQHLLDTFFQNADVNMIAFIPRQVFAHLQRKGSVPTAMVNVMLADACNYSSARELEAAGRACARGYFIERAYRSLFECLEYDSAEHCVAILLFAMVISKAGLHRAWIMHSLSMQMAIRLRFNTLDSPLSALAFAHDTPLVLEWKRRVFWQLYAFDVQTATLSDLPPCLAIGDVRCNVPAAVAADHELAALGPVVVFCDDAPTVALQIDLMGLLCDIHAMQSRLTPEDCLFPEAFMQLHERVAAWRARVPLIDVLETGDLAQIADALGAQPGRVFLGMLAQYAVIFLCLIKDTWLPAKRPMTAAEQSTLGWARRAAYDAALAVHRLVPLVRGMRLNALCPFVSCVVFQACVVSLQSCAWWPPAEDPQRTLSAIGDVEAGLNFLEYVVPRWGFTGILTAALRQLVLDRGFGRKGRSQDTPGSPSQEQTQTQPESPSPSPSSSSSSQEQPAPASLPQEPLSPERMRPLLAESQWEHILRTGEMPFMAKRRPAADDGSPLGDPPLTDTPLMDLCYQHLVRAEQGLDQREQQRQAETRHPETQPDSEPQSQQ
ncbi:hypothetical protein LPJ53_002153 [Coemansia erecta]|uniref:Zn(2)-C6 fungal-type domain-containing protein n=1 Tax=Coemansia erecta TaxID=147472 RepID=A0A9W7XYN9_9FUNG|nr:hypothetical protein LPJ53_002153 [Coemansia erecta]